MKKVIALSLVLIMVLSLCACGNKALTLENLSDIYVQDDDTRASFTFEDGTMTIEIIHYIESSSSPSGKVAGKRESYTKAYTLEGENHITVEGKQYYYEIDEEDRTVNFSVKFMNLAREFYYNYTK